MKLIHKYKSPNFNKRKYNKINLVIIHYTALDSISDSIKYLCAKKNKVSSHYVISEKGQIYNLVSENKRAWHAGQSYWKEDTDINSSSIGIEIDYSAHKKNTKFNEKIIYSLVHLLKTIVKKYKILPENILGHSDIAPYRKIDPGKNFPWFLLEKKKLCFKILNIKEKNIIRKSIYKWYFKNNFKSKKKIILFMLNFIGYDISLALKSKFNFNQIIFNYCNRHKFYKNLTYNKKQIFNVIELHFLNILLTKLKK